MNIGYGEGFVWLCVGKPNEVYKVIKDNGVVVTYLIKYKGELVTESKMNSKAFYSIFSKAVVDCTKYKDKYHKNPSDKEANSNKKMLNKTTSKSGIVVTVGDLWFTNKGTKLGCEVTIIYEEEGVVWVESYSETDDSCDADLIEHFVLLYYTIENETVHIKDTDTDECDDNLEIESYDEGYTQGFADAKYCEEHKVSVDASTFKGAYKIWNETKYAQRREVNSEQLSKERNNSPYFKNVENFDVMDAYLLCNLWGIDDKSGCIQHSIHMLFNASESDNTKSKIKAVTEARDTLNRYLEIGEIMMKIEDRGL